MGFSVIIPCYNNGQYLIEAINSIYNQNINGPYEIIVIDDFSYEKKTKNTLRDIRNFDKVKVIKNEKNLGVQRSRTIGILSANFDIIMILDADDKLISCQESYINKAIKVLTSQENIAFVHTMSLMFGDFEGLTISSFPLNEELAIKKHHIPTSIVFRREDVLKSCMYDTDILKWQDWSFGIALLAQRWKSLKKNDICFLPGPYHNYRIHKSNNRISTSLVCEKKMIELTVKQHSEYFLNFYTQYDSIEDITNYLFVNKPTRIEELLLVAKNDINIAKQIVSTRKANLESAFHRLGIP